MSNENGNSARRGALPGDHPGSYTIVHHVRISSIKMCRVVNLVRGMDISEALATLKFAPQAALEPVYKAMTSAVANAEGTEGLDSRDLCMSKAFVDEDVALRRIRPHARGSAS